jgi:hypothetical protein
MQSDSVGKRTTMLEKLIPGLTVGAVFRVIVFCVATAAIALCVYLDPDKHDDTGYER